MWYNTTQEAPAQLEVFQQKAKKQEDIILYIFDQHPDGLSPWQTFRICNVSGARYPITSVRRAITNLQKNGKLVKTGKQVMGPYGVREYVWKPI